MMQQEEITSLVDKYLRGTITTEERERLLGWYRAQNETEVEWDLNEDENAFRSRVYAKIESRIKSQHPKVIINAIWYRVVAAAIVLIVLAIGFNSYYKSRKIEPEYVEAKPAELILPAAQKAILTLADGTKIILDGTNNSVLGRMDGVTIRKTENGQLIYDFSDPQRSASRNAGRQGEIFDVIETPAGGNYNFNLPDGTKVFLNSSSVLKFPVVFAKNNREVLLTGEAYFEVAKDSSRPFRVESGDQTVEVLGTHFNVNSYANEPVIRTTLIEGSVKILQRNTGEAKFLKPGQEANLVKNGRMTIVSADTEQALGWKNGTFVFNDLQLTDILRQMERWYDVRVDYSTVPKTRYNGVISRHVPLSEALQMLEVTGGMKFSVEKRTIRVHKQ